MTAARSEPRFAIHGKIGGAGIGYGAWRRNSRVQTRFQSLDSLCTIPVFSLPLQKGRSRSQDFPLVSLPRFAHSFECRSILAIGQHACK